MLLLLQLRQQHMNHGRGVNQGSRASLVFIATVDQPAPQGQVKNSPELFQSLEIRGSNCHAGFYFDREEVRTFVFMQNATSICDLHEIELPIAR